MQPLLHMYISERQRHPFVACVFQTLLGKENMYFHVIQMECTIMVGVYLCFPPFN